MKNILFATTALVATAGIASADVSLSGSANVGIINNGTDGAQDMMYQNISITATGAGETDGGLTFGATLTMRSGDDVDLDVGDLGNNDDGDSTGDALDDTANDGTMDALSDISFGSIYVSGEWGKLTFDRDGIDNVHNDDFGDHDVSYAYSGGGLSLTVTADIDNNDADYADGEQWAAKVGYTMDALTFTFATDDGSESDTTIAYAVNDMITASVNYDTDGQTDAETIVKVAYANDGVSAHLAWADDDDDAWEVGLGYTAGAMSFSVVAAENDGAGDTEMDVTASYDLGGGMSIKGATNESGAWFVGTALAF
ncbi:porin [Nereida sp.]|uniref:porin n=1 Tax=Nereida sp. TaxID=2736090 RepID=UPI003F69D6F9